MIKKPQWKEYILLFLGTITSFCPLQLQKIPYLKINFSYQNEFTIQLRYPQCFLIVALSQKKKKKSPQVPLHVFEFQQNKNQSRK